MSFDKIQLQECPFCKGTLKKGKIEVRDFNTGCFVSFVPEEDKGKFFRKNAVSLKLNGEGYHCDECAQFFGVFEKR